VFSFSSKLIEETIKVFKEEDNLDLSPEQANEYLNSFALLFLAFSKKDRTEHLSARQGRSPAERLDK
jgi:hypothetical protein